VDGSSLLSRFSQLERRGEKVSASPEPAIQEEMWNRLRGLLGKGPGEPKGPEVPRIEGFPLAGIGASFQLDVGHPRIKECFPDAAELQIVVAVGLIEVDERYKLIRYYTDDEGFLQAHVDGPLRLENVELLTLWFTESVKSVSSEEDWQRLLSEEVVLPEVELWGDRFKPAWEDTSGRPIAFREAYYTEEERREIDHFMMLYRDVADEEHLLLRSADEIWRAGLCERLFYVHRGIHLGWSLWTAN